MIAGPTNFHFILEFYTLVENQKKNISHRDFLGNVITSTPVYTHKPNRSSLPSYDSVIIIGENDALPSYHEALALSRGTISLHMWYYKNN